MNGQKYLRFTDDHEILTDKGWVYFGELTIGDKVSILKNNVLNYSRLKNINEFKYEGELCQIESNQVSLILTPSNGVYVGNYKGTDFKKRRFSELSGNVCKYLKSCKNVVVDQNIKQFVLYDNGEIKNFKAFSTNSNDNQIIMPIDLWLTICSIVFYSLIITGNSKQDNDIEIVTKNPVIKESLNKLVKYNLAEMEEYEDEDGLVCYTIVDNVLLKNLDFSKSKSRKWFKRLNKEQSKKMLKHLIKEDEKYIKEYIISDKGVADDFQIMCLYAGYASNIHKKDDKWRVEIILKKFDKAKVSIVNNKIINYSGKIYQIEPEDGDTVYIRRNGKGVWT